MMGKGGAMPDPGSLDPEMLKAAAASMKGLPQGMPGGMGGFPGVGGMKLPAGLSGLGLGKKK